MGDANEDAAALATTAGARFRDDLTVFLLGGEDQRSWLNGQVTNDVRHTAKDSAVYCLAVTVKGRIMADLWAIDLGDRFALAIPRQAADQVTASFEAQIIMEDVDITPSELTVLSIQGPHSDAVVQTLPADLALCAAQADELGTSGALVLIEAGRRAQAEQWLQDALSGTGGRLVDEAGYELARLRAARPRFGVDFGLDTYPQEAGLKQRAVSFSKGCYLGQEVVCTLENRGRLSRQLCALSVSGEPQPGMRLRTDVGAEVGQVTSCAHDRASDEWLALGFVKRALATPDQGLVCDTATVRVLKPLEQL